MTIIVRAEIYVVDSRLDEFREPRPNFAAEVGAEAGIIQYRWFSSKDPSHWSDFAAAAEMQRGSALDR